MPEVNTAAVADRDRLEAELADVEVKLSRLRTPQLVRLTARKAELLRDLRTVQRAAQPRATAIDTPVSETPVADMIQRQSSRSCLDPAGFGLLFSAGLAVAELEVRLSVVWPPMVHVQLKDFLEPIGGGYRRQIVPPGRWKVSVTGGAFLVEGPTVDFEFTTDHLTYKADLNTHHVIVGVSFRF